MNASIVTAIISGLCVAIPTIISIIVTSNTRDAVNEEVKTAFNRMDEIRRVK